MAEQPQLTDLKTWREWLLTPPIASATELMEMFCDDSKGSAEIELRRTFNDNGDYIYIADVIWEGTSTTTEETDLGHQVAADAVLLAIGRFIERMNPVDV